MRGVDGGVGVLVHHGDAGPPGAPHLGAGQLQQLGAVQAHAARQDAPVGRQVAHDGPGQGRLARAGFAHQAEDLPRGDGQGYAPDGFQRTPVGVVGDGEVADPQRGASRVQRRRRAHSLTPPGRSMRRSPSLMKPMPTTSRAMAPAGASRGHWAWVK